MLTAEILPNDQLVTWANDALHFRLPFDRPWYYLNEQPQGNPDYLHPRCRCTKHTLALRRYATSDHKASVWIGQCHECLSILWTYK
jgi:hypothetical protein